MIITHHTIEKDIQTAQWSTHPGDILYLTATVLKFYFYYTISNNILIILHGSLFLLACSNWFIFTFSPSQFQNYIYETGLNLLFVRFSPLLIFPFPIHCIYFPILFITFASISFSIMCFSIFFLTSILYYFSDHTKHISSRGLRTSFHTNSCPKTEIKHYLMFSVGFSLFSYNKIIFLLQQPLHFVHIYIA